MGNKTEPFNSNSTYDHDEYDDAGTVFSLSDLSETEAFENRKLKSARHWRDEEEHLYDEAGRKICAFTVFDRY